MHGGGDGGDDRDGDDDDDEEEENGDGGALIFCLHEGAETLVEVGGDGFGFLLTRFRSCVSSFGLF